jgi:hypothetical protein
MNAELTIYKNYVSVFGEGTKFLRTWLTFQMKLPLTFLL